MYNHFKSSIIPCIIKPMNKQDNFIARVLEEREYQRRLWPEPHDNTHSMMEWSAILAKYLGRFSDEACSSYAWNDLLMNSSIPWDNGEAQEHLENMESALVKLAAVALAAYEVI